MVDVLLDVQDLKTFFYTYDGVVKALDGVSFQIRKGEILGLVGETGCGKTITALSIMKLIPIPGRIVQGNILFERKEIIKMSEKEMKQIRGNKISMIFQEPTTSMNPVFTIGEQISDIIRHHQKISKMDANDMVIRMLKLVSLPDVEKKMYQYPFELSGGMQQRVMIAMALCCNPLLLIADEPTTSLDVTIGAQILKLIRETTKKLNTSVLFITHNLGIVAEICDMVAVMYAGNVVESAPVLKFFENPMHPYTRGLLNCIVRYRVKEKKLEEIIGSVPNLINPPHGCRFHPRCQKAINICSKEKPNLTEMERDHWIACHLYK